MCSVVSGLTVIRCANKSGCHNGRGWSLESEEEREINGSSREKIYGRKTEKAEITRLQAISNLLCHYYNT